MLFVAIQWIVLAVGAWLVPTYGVYTILGGAAVGAIVLLWWLFFSRAPWVERMGVIVVALAGIQLTKPLVHVSIAGPVDFVGKILAIPAVCLALVAAVAASRRLSTAGRRVVLAVAVLLGTFSVAVVRVDGVSGSGALDVHWRWTPTPEDRFLAQVRDEPAPIPPAAPVAAATPEKATPETPRPAAPKLEGDWPGFRGPHRDGVVRNARIATDWTRTPPVQLWRRRIGPGWSSFAVAGELLYTQEQRGEDELVSAYRLATGEPVWRHRDRVRFYEAGAGPGPRATPAVHNGRLYTHGATGVVNALDAATGAVIWSRSSEADTGATRPGWGFAGSPLVLDDAVIVMAAGRLVAYDAASGAPRWTRTMASDGYGSPHVATIAGVPQILAQSRGGVAGVASDGTLLWESERLEGGSILQPAVLDGGDVLVTAAGMLTGVGIRRIGVSRQGDTWKVQERWTTRGLKPYFSDYVVHKGHAYGFDGKILAAINLETGERVWKGGRYGEGQMVLLADQDVLLVLSEEGELVLVSATPDKHTEIARFKALEGKTWNHPVLVGDVVLVRNGEEMAAFRLPR